MIRAVPVTLLANLPVRWWGPFEDRLPLHQCAWLAGIATLLAGFAVGIAGCLSFLEIAAQGFHDVVSVDPNLADASKGWALGPVRMKSPLTSSAMNADANRITPLDVMYAASSPSGVMSR
ncbi:MAG: hypothetical protein M3R55_07620 [Acidobacteriota bacterium]|nr:hypothetical protein [Acidobacteriota bacterium]